MRITATIYRAKDRGELVIYKRGASAYLKVAEVAAWIEGLKGLSRIGREWGMSDQK